MPETSPIRRSRTYLRARNGKCRIPPVMKNGLATRGGSFGALLQQWRKIRRMSQLDLAAQANASPRHVCFVETGRAKPSRDMVLVLANALDVPLREQNSFLLAAGFAPVHRETALDAPE